ncbi:MAG: hypothetical protein NVSMB21_19040 [Vulcanimicrobiaceae bacterium]
MDRHDAFVPLAFGAGLLCAYALAMALACDDLVATLAFAPASLASFWWFAAGVAASDVATLE